MTPITVTATRERTTRRRRCGKWRSGLAGAAFVRCELEREEGKGRELERNVDSLLNSKLFGFVNVFFVMTARGR